MKNSTTEICQTFLNFFYDKEHQIIDSSSLVPKDDPTLLFTNAGMNQFKDIFLGFKNHNYSRAATSQRCVRAGGKHNDLENVGYTTRHHTFFEMLGNFSFGDYFKYEAIQYAWELLTSKDWFSLSKERLLITVYETDDETYKIWQKKIGVPSERIIRIGDKKGTPYTSDNFWQMGDTGPCGPCTEIFYDYANSSDRSLKSLKKNNSCYIEIWNIVFMQFNRQIDGTMELLPNPSVDTGMGLERIAAILQNVSSNYEIDLFRTLIKSIAQIIGTVNFNSKSLLVIADHIRSCAFLVADGVVPSNENRGYVLRRIIRRAIRHGNMLGAKDIFFYKLVDPLIEVMGATGKDLRRQKVQVEQVLKTEEEHFIYMLERGISLLNKELEKFKGKMLDGKIAFRLYDTYGFPIDLTMEICYEHGIKVDMAGFEAEMENQRRRAREYSSFNMDYNSIIRVKGVSEFHGYNHLELSALVDALFVDGKAVDSINLGQEAVVILNKTPFYAESGGQIGDKGEIKGHGFSFKVNDTQKSNQVISHLGMLEFGILKVGDNVNALVDKVYRTHISLNHSAVHLMHAALRKIIGVHVTQKGSLVNNKMLRFDFSHFKAMKLEEVHAIENLVNAQIRHNFPIETDIMDLKTAQARGAIMLFNEKYDKYVRVLRMGNFSIEICGGTHALRTGDIGLFRIISESSKAIGVRRIEAVTGENAIINMQIQSNQLINIAQLLKCENHNISNKVHSLFEHNRRLRKECYQLKEQIAAQKSKILSKKAISIKGIKLLISELTGVEIKMLRAIVNNLKNQLGSTIIVLSTVTEGKIFLVSGVSQDATDRVKAEELISMIAKKVGGKGGGRPDIAQGGGTNVAALSEALADIKKWIVEKL